MEKAYAKRRSGYIKEISVGNRRFHRIILEASGGQKLSRLLPQLIEMPLILDTYNRFTSDDMNRSMRHHRELIVAFTAQDADWADAIMRGHIQSARNCYLRSIEEARRTATVPRQARTTPSCAPASVRQDCRRCSFAATNGRGRAQYRNSGRPTPSRVRFPRMTR